MIARVLVVDVVGRLGFSDDSSPSRDISGIGIWAVSADGRRGLPRFSIQKVEKDDRRFAPTSVVGNIAAQRLDEAPVMIAFTHYS